MFSCGRLLGRAAAGGRGRGPRRGDRLERLPLVGGVALDGLDQVGDQVVPPGQLDVDLPPGLLDEVALP